MLRGRRVVHSFALEPGGMFEGLAWFKVEFPRVDGIRPGSRSVSRTGALAVGVLTADGETEPLF